MTNLSIIINAFKNPTTRRLAIGLGLGDLTAISIAIYAIVTGNIRLLAATLTLYIIAFATMKRIMTVHATMIATDDRPSTDDEIEDEICDEEEVEDEDELQ